MNTEPFCDVENHRFQPGQDTAGSLISWVGERIPEKSFMIHLQQGLGHCLGR